MMIPLDLVNFTVSSWWWLLCPSRISRSGLLDTAYLRKCVFSQEWNNSVSINITFARNPCKWMFQISYFQGNWGKDLGMWCTSEMKPSLQVQKAIAKAMQTLSMIKRTFKYLSKDSFLFLYRTYIRPHLEFCVPTWSPYLAKE